MADKTPLNILDAIKYARFIPLVIQIVSAVQALRGPGDGAAKKAEALRLVAAALALTEGLLEKDVLNDEAAMALADKLIELAVQLLHLQPEVEAIAAKIRALTPKTAA